MAFDCCRLGSHRVLPSAPKPPRKMSLSKSHLKDTGKLRVCGLQWLMLCYNCWILEAMAHFHIYNNYSSCTYWKVVIFHNLSETVINCFPKSPQIDGIKPFQNGCRLFEYRLLLFSKYYVSLGYAYQPTIDCWVSLCLIKLLIIDYLLITTG